MSFSPSQGQKRPFPEAMVGPFAFLWEVAVGGYRWDDTVRYQKAPDDRGPHLVTRVPTEARRYAPLAISGLHRSFGRLEPTPGRILRFANRYGLLTGGEYLGREGGIQNTRQELGEPLFLWQREIAHMRHLLDVWELVQRRAAGPLGQLVIWTSRPHGATFRHVDDDSRPVGTRLLALETDEETAGLLKTWDYGDAVEPARYYVHAEVNERLRGHVTPAVLPFRKGEILMFPDSLLSAMYVLFALELSGRQRPAIVCAGCGKYFSPGHGAQRYCKSSCSKKAWYHRSSRSPKVAKRATS